MPLTPFGRLAQGSAAPRPATREGATAEVPADELTREDMAALSSDDWHRAWQARKVWTMRRETLERIEGAEAAEALYGSDGPTPCEREDQR